MLNQLIKFVKDEEGLTTVEYAIAGGLIGAAAITAFQLLGGEVAAIINYIYTTLAAASPV